jgi:nitrate/TMAO reductase-like tetraheme cytochrome c subunit
VRETDPTRNLLRTQMAIAVLLLAFLAGFVRAKDSGPVQAKDICFDCHSVQEGTSIPFKNDIHYKNGVSCADCHGGDPNESDPNVAMSADRGFRLRVTREGVAEFCGRCHSDAAVMQKHNSKVRVDQVKLYAASVHAASPAGSNTIAATCVDCHSVHRTRAVSDPQSTVAPARLAATCGKCHGDSSELFQKSAHAPVFVTSEMPSCATCHSGHATARVTYDMLAGGHAVCSKCHEPDSKGGRTAAALGRTMENIRIGSFTPPPAQAGAARAAGAPAAGGQGRAAGPEGVGAQGRAAATGGRGGRAMDPRMRKALSLVHTLDVAAVRAALEAMQQR